MTPGVLTGSEANMGPKRGIYLDRTVITPKNKGTGLPEHRWRAFPVRRSVSHCQALAAPSHSLLGELQDSNVFVQDRVMNKC